MTEEQEIAVWALYNQWVEENGSAFGFYAWVSEQLNVHPEAARSYVRRVKGTHNDRSAPKPIPINPVVQGGLTAGDDVPDPADVWDRAEELFKKKQEKEESKIAQIRLASPTALAFVADLHVGNPGVDYPRIKRELELITSTPGMYIVYVGDMLDNMIVGKLAKIRAMTAQFTVDEEWALVRRVLEMSKDRVKMMIAGNHDLWTFAVSGIDYLREVVAQHNGSVLYQKYGQPFDLVFGRHRHRVLARHKWRGNSQWNDTHALEKAATFRNSTGFNIAVGAHTHPGAMVREFNAGGQYGVALMCGSYKIHDRYAEQLGLPAPGPRTVPVLVCDPERGIWATSNLKAAAHHMDMLYN